MPRMKCVQVLLIFTAIVGWPCGETSERPNYSINRKLTATIAEYMDIEAKPCSDFYQYACGKWSNEHENDKEYTSATAMVNYQSDQDLIRYMDNTNMAGKPDFIKKVYDLYVSCTDVVHYNEIHYMHWLEEHENMTWALLSSSQETEAEFDWVQTLATLRRYGLNDVFIAEMMYEKKVDLSKNIMDLDKPSENGGFVSMKYEDLSNIDTTVKLTTKDKSLDDLWKEISEFEELLEQLDNVEDDSGEKVITVKELPLPWLNKYMEGILQVNSLDSSMELTIQNIPYMEALDALLKQYDDKFLCRYLEIRFLWFINKTPSSFSEADCMQFTRSGLPAAIDYIFDQLYPELKQEVPQINQMFSNIIKHINATLRTDKRGVIPENFMSKLNNMNIKIGNLPRVDTIKLLESHYAKLTFNKTDFYGNHLKLSAVEFDVTHTITTNELDIENVDEFFTKLNIYQLGADYEPYYNKPENVLIVPLSLLRQPFYHWGYDNVFKYSVLGSTLANYVYKELNLDGFTTTEMQTLSDVGSLHSAFEAYISAFPDNSNKDFSSIGDSMQKVFFVNAAQWYCADDADHNRLNDIVSHLPEFTETFECKLNTFLEIFAHLSGN